MIVLAVTAGVLLLVVLTVIGLYNKLVSYRVEADNAWSQIDVQLKRRHDLIPNLVETVKGVMNFERETLTKVMEARAAAMGAQSFGERSKAEGEISGYLGRLMAVWENYPNLKSNQNAVQLQEELVSTENRIAYSRGHFNDIAANFNTLIAQFPAVMIAGMLGFQKREFLATPETERQAPAVKLN